jgi:phosphoribosylformylglycinamidine cyclo-ligase
LSFFLIAIAISDPEDAVQNHSSFLIICILSTDEEAQMAMSERKTYAGVGVDYEAMDDEGVDIHYAINITGHGWRKLMRATQPFAYIIDQIPMPHPVFSFIQEHGPVDDWEAYANLNMGAGFSVYVGESDVRKVLTLAHALGLSALRAGTIESRKVKRVIIQPSGLEYHGSSLGVR